jgi:thiamine pyrophosphokinase
MDRSPLCVWVLASGPVTDIDEVLRRAPKADEIVAADGGTLLAVRLGVTPDLVVGDIDSSPTEVVAEFEARGVKVRRYDHATKWETDTELAILAALEFDPTTIVILGALGGRLDHSLANILLLAHRRLAGVDVRVIDGKHEVSLARAGEWTLVHGLPGDTVSLLPLGGDAVGVLTDGLHWPLVSETLEEGHGRGVSNTIDFAPARVRLDAGNLLIAVEHLG